MHVTPGVPDRPTVVIIEDDPDTLEMYSLFLGGAGYVVHRAATGGAGADLARGLKPHVVVTDLTLPDLAGAALCQSLRAAGAPDLYGLVVVSGSSDEALLSSVRAAGADEILTKPCLPADLEAAIRRVLNAARDASLR